MPVYEYCCKSCDHKFTKVLKIDERKIPESEPCPSCQEKSVSQYFSTAPGLGDPVRLGVTKVDKGFKEVLQHIHKNTAGSKLDTYL